MSATEVIEQFKAFPPANGHKSPSLSWKMAIPGFLNLSSKAWPMRKPGGL
jgi:hypothetical protein